MKHIIFLLDESGSMSILQQTIINAFNEYLEAEKKLDPLTICSLITFSTQCHFTFLNKPIKEVAQLTLENYIPDGLTSLHDAMGLGLQIGIESQKNNLKPFVIVLTDGADTCSKSTSFLDIKNLLKEINFDVIFIGTTETLYTAQNYGIETSHTLSFDATDYGVAKSFRTLSSAMATANNTGTFSFGQ